jgi:hypothetical protein
LVIQIQSQGLRSYLILDFGLALLRDPEMDKLALAVWVLSFVSGF